MEPIGLAVGVVGLAGLFSTCLEVIDKVDSYKGFGVESRSINAQLEADKLLFTKWAQDVGIDKVKSHNDYQSQLDNPQTNLIVQKILSSIQEIFCKTEDTVSNLQPVVEAGPTSFPNGIHFLNTRQKSQNPKGAMSMRSRIGWSLKSKANFLCQVQQFGALVQRLYSLVPPDGLAGRVNVHRGTKGNDLSLKNDRATWFSDSQRLLIEMEKQVERKISTPPIGRPAFLDWTSPDFPSGTAKILWINGPAGHGKTIICARVVQYLSTILEHPLGYYFCSSESETRRDPLTIIRSWISQVISRHRDTFELVCSRWETKDGRNASQTDIVELFKTIVQHTPYCTFVVDGLDECAWVEEKWKSNDDDSLISFFESIKRAVTNTTTRILILSRDEPEIRYGFRTILASDSYQGLNEYQIRPDDVRTDAMLFSRSIVDEKLTHKSETVKRELSQRMVDRCDGMFLWVKMLEEHLRSWKNKKQLEVTIDQAPTALDHLYDRHWMKISHLPDKDKHRAFSILRWTAFGLRPLTILEITEALLIMDDDSCEDLSDYISNEILAPCGSLLEAQRVEPGQDLGLTTIRLAHFSNGLLITNERLRASSEAFQSNILAKLCLRYLNFRMVWQESLEIQSHLDRRPFRDYASGSWHHHTRESGSNYEEVVKLTNALFSSNNGNWEPWKKWFDTNDDKSKMPESQREITSTNRLFYASLLGLRDTIIYLLDEEKIDVNHVDDQALIVKLLLKKGADVTVANREGWTPLNSASYSGHVDVVKLLLEKGADMTVTSQSGWTPLNSASNRGHVDLVKLLLEKGADMTFTSRNGGHVDIVKLLLEKGADVTVTNNDGGYVDVVKLLLEKGADVTVTNNDGGYVDVVKLLLEKGADVTATNNDGGHVDVVKLLLEKGADMTVTNNNGWAPLNSASNSGHVDVGADMTVTSQNGWTPLNSASNRGHVDVVKLLLERGADITVTNNDGWTALNLASNSGHVDVVKLLLEKGADLLLDMGTDVTVATPDGRTPLSWAARKGREAVMRLLLENGAEPKSKDTMNRTPLWWASRHKNGPVKLLLDVDYVDVDAKDRYNSTALSIAARMGCRDVVSLLLTRSRGLNIKDNFGRTPLWWARRTEHPDIADLLLEKYKENGIIVQEDEVPIATNSALTNEDSRYCDVCILGISDKDSYYYCKICCKGDFNICEDCFVMKAHCLDESHTLTKEIAQVELRDT
ncbi:ankyrin [Amylocarpus encephaloides]|uniref:Ankyrin n=1 Tax=Amylocarpus encephaloides TaxID=45428 RepID=A0A9P7Y860_9HELO|nr:ankyrin [Amylocarpus encephaloides]